MHSPRPRLASLLVLLALANAPAACGSDNGGEVTPEPDSTADAVDSGAETTPVDTGTPDDTSVPDVPDTTVTDSGTDGTTDVPTEVATDVATEASTDVATDAVSEVGGDGATDTVVVEKIACGTSTCVVDTEVCCIDTEASPITATCGAATAACPDAQFDCDGHEDCSGDICCATAVGTYCDTACPTGDFRVCHTGTDCTGTDVCKSCPLGPATFGVCLASSTTACPW